MTAKAKEEAAQTAAAASKQWFDGNEQKLLSHISQLEIKTEQVEDEFQWFIQLMGKLKEQAEEKLQTEFNNKESKLNTLEKEALQLIAQRIEKTPEAGYSFIDWNTRAFAAYSAKQYEDAARYWKRASDLSNASAVNTAQALSNRAVILDLLNRHDEAFTAKQELINNYASEHNPVIREMVAQALYNMGIVQWQKKGRKEAISTYKKLIDTYEKDTPLAIREIVTRAINEMGKILTLIQQPDEAITIYQKLIDSYSSDDTPAIREQVAEAFNSKGFTQLMQAKQLWQDKTQAVTLLGMAQASLLEGHALNENQGIPLGNLAYVQWLLGECTDAEASFRAALDSFNNGGENLYKATLTDIDQHPIAEDTDFRAMIERLWNEHQQQSTSQTHAPTLAQEEATATL